MSDILGLLVFLCIYAIKYGASSLIDVVDRVQAKSVLPFLPFLVYFCCCSEHLLLVRSLVLITEQLFIRTSIIYLSYCCLACGQIQACNSNIQHLIKDDWSIKEDSHHTS